MEDQLLEFCSSYSKIYCYGAGVYGRLTRIFLRENGYDIEGFIVSSGQILIDNVLGKQMIPIDQIDVDESGIILSVSERYQREICEGLKREGIVNYFKAENFFWENLKLKTKFDITRAIHPYVNVLMYHRVCNPQDNPWKIITSLENFEQHVRFLKNNYPILRFGDDCSNIQCPSVVITFDDGYKDNLVNALPVLEKYEVPATVFVSTGILKDGERFWWDRLENIFSHIGGCDGINILGEHFTGKELLKAHKFLYKLSAQEKDKALLAVERDLSIEKQRRTTSAQGLSVEELKKLADSPFISIGAHTVTHSSLIYENARMQEWEIRESKKTLEQITGRTVDTFSYPLGDYNGDIIDILKRSAFARAATIVNGLWYRQSNYEIPRNMVMDYNIQEFERFMRYTWVMYNDDIL